MSKQSFTYKDAGVDISVADAAKAEMREIIRPAKGRMLNTVGAFASIVDFGLNRFKDPLLVLKMEEPGSKQLLALQHGHVESLCQDIINHLINDIVVMGAAPVAVLDAIICGKLEKEIVVRLVKGMAAACQAQDCELVGGETSEQPGVLEAGRYILSASVVGIAERDGIIDGSRIEVGDKVLGIASNGLHTNGYTLARKLLTENLDLAHIKVGEQSFLEALLNPHLCYFKAMRGLFDNPALHGMAHITGGGIQGNLSRILPAHTGASIDLASYRIPSVFSSIRKFGNVADAEMLTAYNMGIGLALVVANDEVEAFRSHVEKEGNTCYTIGEITHGQQAIEFTGTLDWDKYI